MDKVTPDELRELDRLCREYVKKAQGKIEALEAVVEAAWEFTKEHKRYLKGERDMHGFPDGELARLEASLPKNQPAEGGGDA